MPRTNILVTLGLVATIAYLAVSMRSGFIAHDEGLLAQSAERTLAGEAPHVDFDAAYSGGLSYLHALGFRLLGARSSSLRVLLLLFSAGFVLAYFLAAKRLTPTLAAVLATFAAVAWGVKNYFTGIPSWYNLFFAAFGTLALMADADRRRTRGADGLLIIAGLMGGFSLLVKISGVYFVMAGLLYVLYDAQVATHGPADRRPRRAAGRLADACAWLAPPVTAAVLLTLLRHRLEPMDVLHFLLPGAAVAIVPWIAMRRRPADQAAPPDAWFLRRAALFSGGVALPPLLFLAAHVAGHGPDAAVALYRGIFVLPQLRFGYAEDPLPPLSSLLVAAPLLLLFLPAVQRRLRAPIAIGVLAAGLGAVLALAGSYPIVYQWVWSALRPLTPLLVAHAVAQLLRRGGSCEHRRRLYLLASVVAFTSLIQYPYAFGTYFFYVAPLIFLLMLDLWWRTLEARRAQACAGGFLVLFAVLWLNGAEVRQFGVAHQPSGELALLAPDRINLRVPLIQKRGYEAIAEVVRRQTSSPGDVWAGPDAPEIYFLTGKRNPSRNFYQFFDPDWQADLLRLTAGPGIRLVVINRRPEFSPPLSPATLAALAERFPDAVDVGPMQVRWRADAGDKASVGR